MEGVRHRREIGESLELVTAALGQLIYRVALTRMCRRQLNVGMREGQASGKASRAGFRGRLTSRLALATALAIFAVSALAPPALSDMGACRDVESPRSEAEALDRAGFAFDGVVVDGRTVLDPTTGEEVLVSPLTFRVTRAVKGDLGYYGELGSSGGLLVTVWDATYASRNLQQKVLHGRGPEQRLPDEIAVVVGARWRIYALSQVGNWTATTCLGSHVIEVSRDQAPSDQGTSAPWLLLTLLGAGAILLGWLIRRTRRRQPNADASIEA